MAAQDLTNEEWHDVIIKSGGRQALIRNMVMKRRGITYRAACNSYDRAASRIPEWAEWMEESQHDFLESEKGLWQGLYTNAETKLAEALTKGHQWAVRYVLDNRDHLGEKLKKDLNVKMDMVPVVLKGYDDV